MRVCPNSAALIKQDSPDLLRLYERYLLTGGERDRRRLMQSGQLAPDPGTRKWWQ